MTINHGAKGQQHETSLQGTSIVGNSTAGGGAVGHSSISPFQSLLELSALTANNPAQAALISAIIQSGSFPSLTQSPSEQLSSGQNNNLSSQLALAAVFQATANALTNGTLVAAAAMDGLAVKGKKLATEPTIGSTASNGNGNIQTSHLHHHQTLSSQQECANCGSVSASTQLRRYGNLAHYLCTKCTTSLIQSNSNSSNAAAVNQAAAAAIIANQQLTLMANHHHHHHNLTGTTTNSNSRYHRKNSDANSSLDGFGVVGVSREATTTACNNRKTHSGRKVKD